VLPSGEGGDQEGDWHGRSGLNGVVAFTVNC